MRKLNFAGVFFIFIIIVGTVATLPVGAVDVTNPPTPVNYPPIFISGFQVSDQLDVVEIYNESSEPVDLSNWSIQYPGINFGQVCEITFSDWLLPDAYVTAAADSGSLASLLANDNVTVYDSCLRSTTDTFQLILSNGGVSQETVLPTLTLPVSAFTRKGLTKTNRSGKFNTDFTTINRSLYTEPLYRPTESLQLQFSEILVNSRNCSPLEVALDCSDYVKVYNPTSQPIDLSHFRLRNGYLGQSSTTSNTTVFNGIVGSGHYLVLPVTVTNGSSWLWFEDTYGIKRYDNTVQDYPDGSSDTKNGQAWAYDSSDDTWKWTTQTTPSDEPSVFPVIISQTVTIDDSLVPCSVGQYRSLETNRCRSIVTDLGTLIPCNEGQERNPATNRCRSVSSVLGTSDLTPCKPGQERNPETNRCRNVAGSMPVVDYKPDKTSHSDNNFILWLSLGGIILLAVGYGIWEWRTEISKVFKSVQTLPKRGK